MGAWLSQAKRAGYDGVEWAVANNTDRQELERVFALSDKLGLWVILQHFEASDRDFNRHLAIYINWFEKIRSCPCVKINPQTGKDFFGYEENKKLLEVAAGYSQELNIPVVHETHRGKFSFSAHVTKPYLQFLPDLRLTMDVSHWVNVAESYLDDQSSALRIAIERTDHLHARVGYPEGPQVQDPGAGMWKEALEKHLNWWDAVAVLKNASGDVQTISPEFGPYPYMVHHPRTGDPLADQWKSNSFMMHF
jgi:sugar phosphate isomerase/epimerase